MPAPVGHTWSGCFKQCHEGLDTTQDPAVQQHAAYCAHPCCSANPACCAQPCVLCTTLLLCKTLKGKIRQDGSGFATFKATFQCITYRPFKGEVLDCMVSQVNKVCS